MLRGFEVFCVGGENLFARGARSCTGSDAALSFAIVWDWRIDSRMPFCASELESSASVARLWAPSDTLAASEAAPFESVGLATDFCCIVDG